MVARRLIVTEKGSVNPVLVEDRDGEVLYRFHWHVQTEKGGYKKVRRTDRIVGKQTKVRLGWELLGLQPGDKRQAEYTNKKPLDNQRTNLVIVTHRENSYNPDKTRKTRCSCVVSVPDQVLDLKV